MAVDRTTAPIIQDAIEFDFKLPPINKGKLDNGIPLYWLNAGVQDVVEVDWVFNAGTWQESKHGIAQAVAALLKSGTSKRSAQEINEALEYYGASFKARTGNDYVVVSVFTLTKHLPELLPIIYEIFTEATFPQDEIDIFKRNVIQRLMVNMRQCDFVANQRIDALLFGEDHPYGRYTKKDAIEAITREDLQNFFKDNFSLSGVKMFMAGNIGDKETKLLNDVFGKGHGEAVASEQTIFKVDTSTVLKHNIVNDKDGVQGAIRIGSLFPNRHHPDFAPMVVLNTIYGGYFGSRLMSNIREDKGYTYGIYSGLSPYAHGGSLVIQTEVGRDVIEKAVSEIYHEMDVITNDLADEDELLLVKNYLLGNLLGDLDGPFQILQRWRMLILNDLDIAHFDNNVRLYKSITATELRDLAQKYFVKDKFHEVVVV
ncbi:MAG: insulinase family protein [Chitinophagales bacterium]|nr:insulinase family protein [Chitinophagaceae bacterium]MCB9063946.1 insulinase family protein [Chitinophagales bacterium]